jgi:hypothetical protein
MTNEADLPRSSILSWFKEDFDPPLLDRRLLLIHSMPVVELNETAKLAWRKMSVGSKYADN